jgi:hypothetical protein
LAEEEFGTGTGTGAGTDGFLWHAPDRQIRDTRKKGKIKWRTINFRFQIPDSKFQIPDFRFQISESR